MILRYHDCAPFAFLLPLCSILCTTSGSDFEWQYNWEDISAVASNSANIRVVFGHNISKDIGSSVALAESVLLMLSKRTESLFTRSWRVLTGFFALTGMSDSYRRVLSMQIASGYT